MRLLSILSVLAFFQFAFSEPQEVAGDIFLDPQFPQANFPITFTIYRNTLKEIDDLYKAGFSITDLNNKGTSFAVTKVVKGTFPASDGRYYLNVYAEKLAVGSYQLMPVDFLFNIQNGASGTNGPNSSWASIKALFQ